MGRVRLRSSIMEPRARGDGVEARLLQAAQRGDARAQCNLGILYDNGLDDNGYLVEADRKQAVKWLAAAAAQGLPRAQLKLAEVYASAPDDDDTSGGSHTTACGWFLLATAGLHGIHLHQARAGYARLAAQLTSGQIAEATCFARDWRPPPPPPPPERNAAADLSPETSDRGGDA
jgi:TPR repeat protein